MKKYILSIVAVALLIGLVVVVKNKPAAPEQAASAAAAPAVVPAPAAQAPVPRVVPAPTVSQNSGRIIVGIKDKAVPQDSITSLVITVDEIDAHGNKGWVALSKTPKQYDLVNLYKLGATELFSDTRLAAGTYNQLRLVVSKIMVTPAGGAALEAKLPSRELKMNVELAVMKNENTGLTLDFQFNKSLHVTGEGKYIFAPVVLIETRNNVDVQKLPNNRVDILSGTQKFSRRYGMDEGGAVKADFVIDPEADLSVTNGFIKVTPKAPVPNIKITAEAAVDRAIANKIIDSAVAVKLEKNNGAFVWRITGKKDFVDVVISVDVATGQVVATD